MAGIQNFWEFCDDFIGGGTFGTSASEFDPWVVTDTSVTGTPTYTRLDHGETSGDFAPGVAELKFASTSEVENVCLSFGDKLAFDINKVQGFETRLRQGQATKDAATTMAWGLTGDRNDAIDSIANAALFRLASTSADNAVVVESDDGTNNNDDVSTGKTLANSFIVCKIDLSTLTNVKFFFNGFRVGAATTFDMSNYAAGLQPFFQIQKTADTNTDALEIDYVKVWGIR